MSDTYHPAGARAGSHNSEPAGTPAAPMYAPLDAGWDVGRGEFSGPHAGKGPRGYQRRDQRIHEDVNEALTAHPHLDATDVEVQCQDGVVTLSGQVSTRRCKRTAEDVAHAQPGVRGVENQLGVADELANVDDTGIDEVASWGMAPVNDGPRY